MVSERKMSWNKSLRSASHESLCWMVLRPSVGAFLRLSKPRYRSSCAVLHFLSSRFAILTAASATPFAFLLSGLDISWLNPHFSQNSLNLSEMY